MTDVMIDRILEQDKEPAVRSFEAIRAGLGRGASPEELIEQLKSELEGTHEEFNFGILFVMEFLFSLDEVLQQEMLEVIESLNKSQMLYEESMSCDLEKMSSEETKSLFEEYFKHRSKRLNCTGILLI